MSVKVKERNGTTVNLSMNGELKASCCVMKLSHGNEEEERCLYSQWQPRGRTGTVGLLIMQRQAPLSTRQISTPWGDKCPLAAVKDLAVLVSITGSPSGVRNK